MARLILLIVLACGVAFAQQAPPAQQPVAEPAEEDATIKPEKEYSFNPLQAEKEIAAGRFYMKRGSSKGAAQRFEEATKWNPQSAEAFLLLGEAKEKMGELKAARAAFEKYLELAPDAKNAGDVRKRVAKLPAPKTQS